MTLNIDDINNSLNYIREENPNYPNEVSDRLKANEFNLSCRKIENQLNVLYEKIRLLQDLDSFVTEYAQLKIKEAEDKLKNNLKIIEDAADLYQDTDAVALLVPMQCDDGIIRDRDGAVIPQMDFTGDTLDLDANHVSTAGIASISRDSNVSCYNCSYDNLRNGQTGVSCYYVTDMSVKEVSETVTVNFTNATPVNHILIAPVGAEVSNIQGILPNHVEVPINSQDGYFAEKELIGIKFTLSTSQYKNVAHGLDNSAYDETREFGIYPGTQTQMNDRQTIKNIEKSISEANKTYIIDAMDSVYNTWDKFNKSILNKNINLKE